MLKNNFLSLGSDAGRTKQGKKSDCSLERDNRDAPAGNQQGPKSKAVFHLSVCGGQCFNPSLHTKLRFYKVVAVK